MRTQTPQGQLVVLAGLAVAGVIVLGIFAPAVLGDKNELVVTATAYNSVPGQTSGDPHVGAWGDRLEPGMRVIAVSRDLLDKGLTRGVEVKIEGLPGTYEVRDKLAARWERRIDIYMGEDVEAAREWGKRKVRIVWPASDENS